MCRPFNFDFKKVNDILLLIFTFFAFFLFLWGASESNRISEAGVVALVDALRLNRHLVALNLSWNKVLIAALRLVLVYEFCITYGKSY